MKQRRSVLTLFAAAIWSVVAFWDVARLFGAKLTVAALKAGDDEETGGEVLYETPAPDGWTVLTAVLSSLCALLNWVLFFRKDEDGAET